ncbi:MAG: 50S ribosomal protein L1 [Candidatus Marsarchaeota archaeon]|nr:50S ribosomal protein L1 [Candidatus Marsarchaeota archaeon]MCL5418317.1 50S ribosomal protein L1 [Candidatus Marsarchaeota archaeon]
MDEETQKKISSFIEENKGKRKFNQSVELAINFFDVDFSKQNNRINMDVKLPYGRGKESSIIVFADDRGIVDRLSEFNIKVIPSSQLQTISTEKEKMRELLSSNLFAQPSLMPQIAKVLGTFLGPRNRMPRPLMGDIKKTMSDSLSSISIRSKGKYLPTVHCVVGSEKMDIQKIISNIDEVISQLSKKVGRQHIKSAYVKLTMSKPLKFI